MNDLFDIKTIKFVAKVMLEGFGVILLAKSIQKDNPDENLYFYLGFIFLAIGIGINP